MFKRYKTISKVMFFKHYPGLFIPLDRGTPSVFQLPSKHQAWECWPVQCQHCQKPFIKNKTNSDTLERNLCMKINSKCLHQHDNNSSTVLSGALSINLCFASHSWDPLPHKSNFLRCKHVLCTTTGLAIPLQNAIKQSLDLRQTWDVFTVNFQKRTNSPVIKKYIYTHTHGKKKKKITVISCPEGEVHDKLNRSCRTTVVCKHFGSSDRRLKYCWLRRPLSSLSHHNWP